MKQLVPSLGVALVLVVLLVAAVVMIWTLVRVCRRLVAMPAETERLVHAIVGPLVDDGSLKVDYRTAISWQLSGTADGRPVVVHVNRGRRASTIMSLTLHIRMPDQKPTAVEMRRQAAASVLAPRRGIVKVSGGDLFCRLIVPPETPDSAGLIHELARAAGS